MKNTNESKSAANPTKQYKEKPLQLRPAHDCRAAIVAGGTKEGNKETGMKYK